MYNIFIGKPLKRVTSPGSGTEEIGGRGGGGDGGRRREEGIYDSHLGSN